MELKTCKNGHLYDPSISPDCPECAALAQAGATLPLEEAQEDYGKTEPLQPSADHWAKHQDYISGGTVQNPVEDYGPTKPVGYRQEGSGIQPVVGWLVCVDGPEKGRDYRIHAQNNYIGRANSNDICIPEDPSISRERHAILAYDLRSRAFYFAPSGGASIVYCNGAPVLNSIQLKQGDRLEIGQSSFLFVPLCGESFQWD